MIAMSNKAGNRESKLSMLALCPFYGYSERYPDFHIISCECGKCLFDNKEEYKRFSESRCCSDYTKCEYYIKQTEKYYKEGK